MHLHPYLNESSNSEQFADSVILQEIKKIQSEEDMQKLMHLHPYMNESSNIDQFSEGILQAIKHLQYEEAAKKVHHHPYFNESSISEQFSESIILQEIRKIQIGEEVQEVYNEESTFLKWFFKINRENGGAARFECMGIQLPLSLDITYLVWILAFVIPVIGFCLILPALRKKAFSSFFVVMMFSSTGLALITGLLTTSWLVGEVEGKMTLGLHTRCNARVGMWVGLTTINITLERPYNYLNERISINDHVMLKTDQNQAMVAGWPWPILLILEYLTGEGKHWAGSLGFYLNRAGRTVYVVLYFSTFLWIVWMFCFTIAAHLACKPLLLSGILELMSVFLYAIQIHVNIAPYVMLEDNKLSFSFGWSWWFTLFLGCLHLCCGLFLYLYDYFRPGKLSTIFEVDFGLPTHRLNIKKHNLNFDNESSLDNTDTDDGFDSDNCESNTYESFHRPNPLQPSPDLSEIRQQGIVDDVCYTPDNYSPPPYTSNDYIPLTPSRTRTIALTPTVRTPNARTPNARTPNARTPNARTPNARTPTAHTPSARTLNVYTPNSYTPNDCTSNPAEISSKALLQGLDIPVDHKTNYVKRNIFQQKHSTPHKIYVH